MYFFKGTPLKVVLPLVLALSLLAGAAADAQSLSTATPKPLPTPPSSSTAVQLQTYGVLPVMVINLTQSPINYNISFPGASMAGPNPAPAYTNANAPVAIGLHGWSTITNNATAMFNNPTTPLTPPSGASNSSLSPVVTVAPGSSASTANPNWSFMNAFAMFPSWNTTVSFPNTNYANFPSASGSSLRSFGATPGPQLNSGVPGWYTTSSATAYGQSMANSSVIAINLYLVDTTNPSTPTAPTPSYSVNITSEGGGTGGYQPNQNSNTPINWYGDALQIFGDLYTVVSMDPICLITSLMGIPDTVAGIYGEYTSNSNTTNLPYPATYKGIYVNGDVNLPAGYTNTSTATEGNNDYLVYTSQVSATSKALPIEMQNTLFIATTRQPGPGNNTIGGRNSADTLIILIINEGLYSANQTQQFLNSNAPVKSALDYKPTKEQAEDSLKILGILTAISKKNPLDAQKIIELFGFYGQHEKTKNDPNAAAGIKIKLKEVLEKYQREIPAIEPYLVKLAQKR